MNKADGKKEKTYLYVPLSKIKFILNDNLRGRWRGWVVEEEMGGEVRRKEEEMEGMGSRGGECLGGGDG